MSVAGPGTAAGERPGGTRVCPAKTVSLQAPMPPSPTEAGDARQPGSVNGSSTQLHATGATLTCAELLAFSGAQSAALAASFASNFAMHRFYSTLGKGECTMLFHLPFLISFFADVMQAFRDTIGAWGTFPRLHCCK